MADPGIGIGIGRGLSGIAEGIRQRGQYQYADREKRADALEQQARDIATNIAKIGGKDKPEAQPYVAQLQQIVSQHNALYPPHETPALIARIKKFMGKQPGQAQPDPRASMTAENQMATAPVQEPKYTGDASEFIQLSKLAADPSQSPDVRATSKTRLDQLTKTEQDTKWEKIGEPKLDKTTGRYYQVFIDPKDPSKQKTVKLGMEFQPTGTQKSEAAQPSEEEIAAGARMWTQYGVAPPAKLRSAVEKYMVEHQMAPQQKVDTSPQGRLAKALMDSGKAKTSQDANTQAATMIVDAQKAKEKANAGSSMNAQELAALAQFDVLSGSRTAFGLGRSGDRDAYNRAKADLLVGGSGSLLTGRADVKATQTALSRLQTVYSQTLVNEQNARKNFALSKQLGERMDRESMQVAIPLLNEWVRTGQIRLSGNPAVNNFMSNLQNTLTEYAKVVTGQTSGAAVTDSARAEMQRLLDRGLSTSAINDWIDNVAGPDMNNRISSYKETIQGLQDQMRGVGGTSNKVIKFEDLPK